MKTLLPFILSFAFLFTGVFCFAQDSSRMTKETAFNNIKRGNEKGEKITQPGRFGFDKRKLIADSLTNNSRKKIIPTVKWKTISN